MLTIQKKQTNEKIVLQRAGAHCRPVLELFFSVYMFPYSKSLYITHLLTNEKTSLATLQFLDQS